MAQRPIAILGSGGHARVVADACARSSRTVAGFIGPVAQGGPETRDTRLLGSDLLLDDAEFVSRHEFVVGIGDQRERARLARRVRDRGGNLATVIHPDTSVAAGTTIGAGSVLLAGAVINFGGALGECVIIHSNASVDHDARLADGVQVCPGAALAGGVTCETNAFVGIGASVIQGIQIGARAVVGAGAVVIANVPPDVTVVGNPAHRVSRGTC